MNRKGVEKLIVEMLDYQVWPDTSGQEKVQANTFGALGRFDPFVILAGAPAVRRRCLRTAHAPRVSRCV
jgi:hypothetical protein